MIRDVLSEGHQTEPRIKLKKLGLHTQQAQEMIYQFLLELVRKQPPAQVLEEFKRLFIDYDSHPGNLDAIQSISILLFSNNEKDFRNTLKRSCYILINNWETSRNYSYIKELVELFSESNLSKKTLSPGLGRLRNWLGHFVNSKDYNDLKLFILKYGYSDKEHWSNRYTSYLLVPQYTNPITQQNSERRQERFQKN
jgi:hypothetical protein